MNSELLYFNGINAESGAYDLPPIGVREMASFIQGETPPDNLRELSYRHQQKTTRHLSIREGIDLLNLEQTGWGVIFAPEIEPSVREALQDLLDLRARQAGENFKILESPRPGESKTQFLARYGVGPGPADPQRMPYYLLLVASPEQVSFEFQAQLDLQYAVGRICFDTPDEYARYARSVCLAESGALKLPRQATFFSPGYPGDPVSAILSSELIRPLSQKLREEKPDWQFSDILAAEASKARLNHLLNGDLAPALLCCAGHGLSFSDGSPHQRRYQGALLCQDWPGLEWPGPISPDFYFSGDDLAASTNLLGLVAVLFASYGAGMPASDPFVRQVFKQRQSEGRSPFAARLPMQMLARGALAVLSPAGRAWGYTLPGKQMTRQVETLVSTLVALLNGTPLGAARDYIDDRYAETATILNDVLEEIEFGKRYDPTEIVDLWLATQDTRSYTLLGDPAVHLPVATGVEAPRSRAEAAPIVISIQSGPTPSAPPDKPENAGEVISKGAESDAPISKGVDFDFESAPSGSLQDVTQAMLAFSQNLLKQMERSLVDNTTITVRSCLVEDPDESLRSSAEARSFAVTRVDLDGDTQVFLSKQGGGPSADLMRLHNDTVQLTLTWRTETFKAMSATLGTWLRPGSEPEG